jgi:membrane protein
VVCLAATATWVLHLQPGDLETVTFRLLGEVMPAQALELVEHNVDQILGVLQTRNTRLLAGSLVLALWTAAGGMRAVIVTLNRAYNVREGRGPWRIYGVSLLATVALTMGFLLGLPLLSFAAALIVGVELVYYIAPNARRPFHWVTAGSIVAVLLWILATWAFSEYVSRFGRYEALYAGLGAPVVLLLWFYIAGLALLLGGEINAEIERQSGFLPRATVPAPPTVDAAGHDTTVRDQPA